ncbi:uncharacterized protein LOC144115281 [Amblyomma americanum]
MERMSSLPLKVHLTTHQTHNTAITGASCLWFRDEEGYVYNTPKGIPKDAVFLKRASSTIWSREAVAQCSFIGDVKTGTLRWRNLRDTFCKKVQELKKKSSSWLYFEQMMFLRDIIEPRGSGSENLQHLSAM